MNFKKFDLTEIEQFIIWLNWEKDKIEFQINQLRKNGINFDTDWKNKNTIARTIKNLNEVYEIKAKEWANNG